MPSYVASISHFVAFTAATCVGARSHIHSFLIPVAFGRFAPTPHCGQVCRKPLLLLAAGAFTGNNISFEKINDSFFGFYFTLKIGYVEYRLLN